MSSVQTAQRKAKETASEANPALEVAMRIGYVAKGVIYGLIGVLALLAAAGKGGGEADQRDVINTVGDLPFGSELLIVLGVGLACYGLFRLVYAAFNPEMSKAVARIGMVVTGFAYCGFAVLSFLASAGQKAQDHTPENAGKVMSYPNGHWLIAAVGVVVLAAGTVQVWKGFSKKFLKVFRTDRMDKDEMALANTTGTIGLIAVGIVFMTVGGFVIAAGLEKNPSKANGIDLALTAIGHAPYGRLLLGLIGMGLILYGVFMCVEAKFRRFEPVQPR